MMTEDKKSNGTRDGHYSNWQNTLRNDLVVCVVDSEIPVVCDTCITEYFLGS